MFDQKNITQEEKYPIREEWEEYYKFLEGLRRTGVCNMFGASIYLVEAFHVSEVLAKAILINWMENYKILSKRYKWDR